MLTKVLIYMVLFFLIASPATFKIVRKALGSWVASPEGLPHSGGLLLHSAIYVLLACYLPAKLVSGFEGEYYEDEQYIGEYGAEKTPFGLSDGMRQVAGNPASIY